MHFAGRRLSLASEAEISRVEANAFFCSRHGLAERRSTDIRPPMYDRLGKERARTAMP